MPNELSHADDELLSQLIDGALSADRAAALRRRLAAEPALAARLRELERANSALRDAYARLTPRRPQRHLVVNTLVTDWNDHEASAVSDVIFLLKSDAGWTVQLVGRYRDVLHCAQGTWRFHRRTAEFVP